MSSAPARLNGVGIGAGYFSQFHYEAWMRLDGADITAVCDLDAARAQACAKQFGIARSYDNVDRMLEAEQPDFVDIITRPESHLDLVHRAAERGIAVICQKPLAPSFDEARQIVTVAARAGIPFMVHENFRFQPWHREMRRLVDRGAVGDRLHMIAARTRMGDGWQPDAYLGRQPYFRDMPRLLVYETGVHFIDTFRYLAGEIDGVYARLRQWNGALRGEDAGILLLEFQSGADGLWDANRFNESNTADPRYTFGEFLLEGNGGSLRLYSDGCLTCQALGQLETEQAYERPRQGFAGDSVLATQQHFVAQLASGEPFETRGEDYLRTLVVQEAVYESAAGRVPVRDLVASARKLSSIEAAT